MIGLDQLGYGRIFGQCMYGAKIFYCMWMTTARDYDDFICLNCIDLPKDLGMSLEEAKTLIRRRILGRDNVDLHKVCKVDNANKLFRKFLFYVLNLF